MADYIGKPAQYEIEMACNADARGRNPKNWPSYWANNLFVSHDGQYAYIPYSGYNTVIFPPYEGEGEPRPTS